MPANILNLPAYVITSDIIENEHDYHIDAEVREHPTACQSCRSPDIVGFGRNVQQIRDLCMHAKRVGIYVDTRRYKCRACGKTFYERLPDVDAKRSMTNRLVKWLGVQSIKRPFAHLAEEIGVHEVTVKNVFLDYVAELERTVKFETPQWMGMDEIHVIKKPRGIITNIKNNTVVDVLRDRKKETISNYLFRLPCRQSVKCVTMDMWEPYKDAVRAVLPQATIVIDKFHVVRMANDCLETVRKGLRAELDAKQRRGLMHDRFILLKREAKLEGLDRITLESWTKNYPALGAAYQAKEDFFAIYDAKSSQESSRRFRAWETGLAPEIQDAFTPLITAVNNWMPEIMNYFDFEHPVTNAYTESLNSLIRVIDRLGRGYHFEALRAKILYTGGFQKSRKPKFTRPAEPVYDQNVFYHSMGRSVASTRTEEVEVNYGVDISTLVRMIEEGQI